MKKSLLAGCIVLATAGAQAELSPMSEFELHNVTGQAGIDIELDVGIEIGEIRYTDTAEVVGGVSDGDGGSLRISNIKIGGIDDRSTLLGFPTEDNGPNLDDLIFKVDIDSNGDLVIDGVPVGSIRPVDIKITTGPIETLHADGETTGVRLIDSLSMYGGALGLKMTVMGSDNDIRFRTQIGFDDIDIDMSTGFGIKIEDAFLAGSNHDGDPSFFTDSIADISVLMYKNDDEGITFDFTQPTKNGQNVFDLGIGSLVVGNGLDSNTGQEQNIGAFFVDNLDITGVAINVSGHQ